MGRMTVVQAFWGHLTKINQVWQVAPPEDGVTDSSVGDWLWTLRCDCGQEVELLAKEFPGRRRMRDCGGRNPECMFSHPELRPVCPPQSQSKPKYLGPKRPPGRPPSLDPGVLHSFYLPRSLMEEVKMRAATNGISLNRALVDLVRLGQAYELVGELRP